MRCVASIDTGGADKRGAGSIVTLAALVAFAALPGCFLMPKGHSTTDVAAQSSLNLQRQFDVDKDRLARQERKAKSDLELRFSKVGLSIEALEAPAEDPRRVAIEISFATETNRWQEVQKQAGEITSWSIGVETAVSADIDKLSAALKNHDKDYKSIRTNLSNLGSNISSLRVAVKRGR